MSYKYQRLRERLRSAVKTGELAGKLPGERELARRFSANAKTINKALNDLAMEGLVLRHVGRGTFVAGPGAGLPIPAVSTRRIVWIVPSKSDAGDHSRLLSEARELLEIKGHRIDQLAMDLTPAGELEGTSLTYRELRQVDGVFLSARPSSQLLAGLRRRRIPVVMIDNHSETVRLPAVVVDQAHGAFAICEKCIQLGHVRIQVLA